MNTTVNLSVSKESQDIYTEKAFVRGEQGRAWKEKSGHDPFFLNVGEPDFNLAQNIIDAEKRALDAGKTHYTPNLAVPELRKAVAEYYRKTKHIDASWENIAVTTGAKIIISFTVQSIMSYNSGSEIIIPIPCYPIDYGATLYWKATPITIPLLEKNNFCIDVDDVARNINDRTRLIMLTFPGNPTGVMPERKQFEELAKVICKYPNCLVLSDEVYSKQVYDKEFVSISEMPGMLERTFVMDGCSKQWAMTGSRIGFVHCPSKDYLASFNRLVGLSTGCPNQPAQWAALEALTGPQDEPERMRTIFKERRDYLVKRLNQIPGVTCLIPGGAFYVFPNCTEAAKTVGAKTTEEFLTRMLHEADICATSAEDFGPAVPGAGIYVRFSYASSMEVLQKAAESMERWIRSYMK